MTDIQFEMELDTPLGGPLQTDYINGHDYKGDTERRRKKTDLDSDSPPSWGAERVYPSTSSPSSARNLSTSHHDGRSISPSRSPKAYRASLPHTYTLEATQKPLTTQVVNEPPPQLQNSSSYHQVKMKYMRSLNFTPEELKSLRMRGRDRSQTISLPLGQSMPIPVANGQEGGLEARLSSSVYDADDGASFIPPHELVKHDETFSVWYYEQKKLASNKAV